MGKCERGRKKKTADVSCDSESSLSADVKSNRHYYTHAHTQTGSLRVHGAAEVTGLLVRNMSVLITYSVSLSVVKVSQGFITT